MSETTTSRQTSTNLRRLQSPFVGRDEELEQLEGVLEAERVSLVTLTGPPGTGKTRLAREFGWRLLDAGPPEGGVWFADLAAADGVAEMVETVAGVLDVSLQSSDSVEASRRQIERTLEAARPTLLILDNFEHLVDAGAEVVERWVDAAAEVQFLATSREPLGLPGERTFELGPLPVEQAVRLFERRAGMVDRGFSVSEELEPTVVELVERLDRLPLATELAAARVRTLPPRELLDRLEDRFRVLKTPDRLEDRRQATLEEAVRWSWELLDAPEREALCQCTVFRGGFSLEAAESVVELQDDAWTVDVLDGLVRKSLLQSRRPDAFPGEARFRMFESVRDFADRHLEDDARQRTRRRHARHFARRGREWARRASRRDGDAARQRLSLERANLSAAFEGAVDTHPDLAVRLGWSLDRRLQASGPVETHRRLLDQVVDQARATDTPAHRVRARRMRGRFRALRGELEAAVEDLDAAVQRAEGPDHVTQRGWALFRLGSVRRNQGDLQAATARLEEALALAEDHALADVERTAIAHLAACEADRGDLGAAERLLERLESTSPCADLRIECRLQKRVGTVHYYLGDYEAQHRRNRRALELARLLEDRELEGICLQALGDSAFADADFDGAVERYRQALQTHRELGNDYFEGVLLGNLGTTLHRTGALDEAIEAYRDSLQLHRRTGAAHYEAIVTFALGAAEFERDRHGPAVDALEKAADRFAAVEQTADRAAALWTEAWIRFDAQRHRGDAPTDGPVRDGRSRTRPPVELLQRAAELFDAADDAPWCQLADASREVVSEPDQPLSTAPHEDARLEQADRTCRRLYQTVDALAAPDTAELDAILETLRAAEGDVAPLTQRSLYARVLARVTDHRLDAVEEAEEAEADSEEGNATPDLIVGPEGRWFRRDDATSEDNEASEDDDGASDRLADLRRRGSLRRILDAMTRTHLDPQAEPGFDVHELFDIGWPDQQADPDSAADRVYWAIRELRKAGLEGLLQTTDAGYLLAPGLELRRADAPTLPEPTDD